jgi:hypothetical protein
MTFSQTTGTQTRFAVAGQDSTQMRTHPEWALTPGDNCTDPKATPVIREDHRQRPTIWLTATARSRVHIVDH